MACCELGGLLSAVFWLGLAQAARVLRCIRCCCSMLWVLLKPPIHRRTLTDGIRHGIVVSQQQLGQCLQSQLCQVHCTMGCDMYTEHEVRTSLSQQGIPAAGHSPTHAELWLAWTAQLSGPCSPAQGLCMSGNGTQGKSRCSKISTIAASWCCHALELGRVAVAPTV